MPDLKGKIIYNRVQPYNETLDDFTFMKNY